MIKLNYKEKFAEILASSTFRFAVSFILFTVAMTFIVSSQNFFFQKIVENGISKKDVIAEKTIVVVDTYGTFENPNEVSYDIIAAWEGRDTLFKHIGEHMILKKV